ncbi:hypothetical protein ABZ719_34820 [Streptomyces sp. NPDC006743]
MPTPRLSRRAVLAARTWRHVDDAAHPWGGTGDAVNGGPVTPAVST